MPAIPSQTDRGVALLIVLALMAVLVPASLELNRRARDTVMAAAAARDRLSLSQMAEAGTSAAMAVLIKDKLESTIDSIQEDWAHPEKIAEVLQDLPFDKGKVDFTISDELARIQVNALVEFPEGRSFNESQKIMWDRFTRLLLSQHEALEELEATTIVNSVKDWLDSGDDGAITGLDGAESEFYRSLDPPYTCRNGPLPRIDELVLVKGIIPELFHGIGELPGISRFMTVHGMSRSPKTVEGRNFAFDGKININTAPLPVLVAVIPSENPEYAQLIHDYRHEKDGDTYIHDLSRPTWYRSVDGIPGDLRIDPKLLTTASDLFRIEVSATLNGLEKRVETVVQREKAKETGKWKCKVLSRWTG